MKVLFAVSEVAPIIKLGGLGDVAGALPKSLQRQGVNIDVIVPFYPRAKTEGLSIYKALELNIPFGGENFEIEVFKTRLPDTSVDVYLLRNSHFFNLGGQSAFANNISETKMFMFFDRAVVEFIKSQFNTYDIVHCNDWHTGLITHLLKDELHDNRPATLFTIHNIMYQGVGDLSSVEDVGFAPGQHALVDWDLEDGDVNMMLQGITSSDFINTVSPTYARELVTKHFGGGFSDILRTRSGRLSGILNGVDYTALPRYYDVDDVADGKTKAKELLVEKLGLGKGSGSVSRSGLAFSLTPNLALPSTPNSTRPKSLPIFAFIGRLDPQQKGLDLLYDLLRDFPPGLAQFVVLGTGDPAWEKKLKNVAKSGISVNTVFDEELALEIYAGADFLLVPSRYEPCGLIQMNAMWYGTLPIVHGVGGLKDTVTDGVTGFVFDDYSSAAFRGAIDRALGIYSREARFAKMRENAMLEDFSWEASAGAYKRLYEKMLRLRV